MAPTWTQTRVIRLGLSLILLLFYFSLLGMVFNPQVPPEYDSYYIEQTDPSWSGMNAYSYSYGTVLNFTSDPGADQSPVTHLAGGWYDKEPTGTWTKGESASLHFSPNSSIDSGLQLRFRGTVISNEPTQNITVLVNSQQVQTLTIRDSGWQNLTVNIPASNVRNIDSNQLLNVTFLIGSPTKPSDISNSSDTRRLGLAIKWFVMEKSSQ